MSQTRLQECSPMGMAMRVDWNDLRYFLAMLDEGSSKRAAAALRVSQTTCVRRLAALEAALGIDLFSLDEGRYVATDHALALRDAVRAVGSAAQGFEQLAESRKRNLVGSLKVTCDEILFPALLMPPIAALRRTYPDVSVDLDISATLRDIEAGEADFAIRAGQGPTDESDSPLVWHKLGDDPLAVFASASYADPPRSAEELLRHPLICYDTYVPHVRAASGDFDIRHVSNSWRAIMELVGQGAGVGIIPQIIAGTGQNLRHCFDLPSLPGLWIVYPAQLKRVPYVRALRGLVQERFDALAG